MEINQASDTMTRPERLRKRLPKAVRVLGYSAGSALVALIAALIAGIIFPGIPAVGLASFVVGQVAWIGLAGALACGISVWLFTRHRSVVRAVFVGVTALTVLGAGIVTGRTASLGSEYGFAFNPFAAPLATSQPDEVRQYKAGEMTHDVAIWNPTTGMKSAAPIALFVHGGGWITGTATDNSGEKRWFADRGWLVLSVDYSLSSESKHLWDTTGDQITCAMAWAGRNAASLGGDLSRFVMLGDSAGGNLAINAAYQASAGTAKPACDDDLPAVAAVATVYPAVDPKGFHDNNDVLLGSLARQMTEEYTGGTPNQFPGRYDAITSSTYIHPSAPPTLIIASAHDHLVPPGGAYDFDAAASDAGIATTLVKVPFADHIFDSSGPGAQVYLEVTQAWLRSLHLAPPAP